jgi:hypothetical protein
METLSYGYKKPGSGDKGSPLFAAMNENVQRTNDHDHTGTNSAKLTTGAGIATTKAILAAAWVSQGGGTFRQVVSMPSSLTWGQCAIQIQGDPDGHVYNLTLEKVTDQTFAVYCNDNSKSFKAVFAS